MPAGCEPGPYQLGEVEVELHRDGSVRLAGGSRLAGSALQMDRAISNLMRFAGLGLRDAVTMATRNPGRVTRIPGRQRGLARGERADIVRFQIDDEAGELQVLETYLNGVKVFSA
jgi:N-acetylglucosamine-6-phosphate deacetylase